MSATPLLPRESARGAAGASHSSSREAPWPGPGDPLRSLPVALLAAATAWVSVLAWRGLAQDPGRISRPLIVAGLLIALLGWAVRRSTGRAWTAVPVQLMVLLIWLMHGLTGAWLPQPASVHALIAEIGDGVLASQRYYSPVSVEHPQYHFLITLGGVGIILAVDLAVCGARQPALAGLPLLLVVTIAASVLIVPINPLVFIATALGWLALLAVREAGRLDAWTHRPDPIQLLPAAAVIAGISVVTALILTGGVSAEGRLLSGNDGSGDGNGSALNLNNPLLDMRRNLRQDADIPLVRINAPTGADPEYLRLTVLDDFTGKAWTPSSRSRSNTDPVRGRLPLPTGLSRANLTASQTWRISVLRSFDSSWLPLPTPTTSVDVDSRWRYDPDTLDVLSTQGTAAGLDYQVRTFEPKVDPDAARAAGPAPASLQSAMTSLPGDLPSVFVDTAKRVSRGASNNWDRALALQEWFRSSGGFTYSTEPAPGNGIDTLSRFISSDRVGYCEQFASAMTVMARSLGIPARVSVGFLQSEQTSVGNYTFSSRDLHAWPELYFPGQGWTRFEPTPGIRTGSAPSYTEQQAAPVPSTSPTPQTAPTPKQAVPTPDSTSTTGTGDTGHRVVLWVGVGLLALVVIGMLLALPRLLRRRKHQRRWAGAQDRRAIADTAWEEVRETARDLDLEWSDTSSVRTNGALIRSSVVETEAQQALEQVVRFVELTRYARPDGSDSAQVREQMLDDVTRWRAAAYDAVDPRVARRARWFPRRR